VIRARSSRGFVLPVVLLLALVAGIIAAVVLESQGTQRQVVERELREYQTQHFERGIREVVGAWTDTLIGQRIQDLLDDDGHALDLTTPDGFYCAVYLFDGQGSVLTSPAGLNEADREDAGGILDMLGQITGDNPDPSWLRPVGPVRVCLASAPVEVLTAVAGYAARDLKAGQQFAQNIAAARAKGDLVQSDVDTAMNAARVSAEDRPVLQRLVTIQPDLWAMVVDVYDPAKPTRDGTPTVRYLGRFQLPGQNGARQVSLQSLGKFLSWEELPVTNPAAP
jgi:hypothetical protein